MAPGREVPSGSAFVVTNLGENCSPEVCHVFLEELLDDPVSQVDGLDAAQALRELQPEVEA